MIKADAYSCHSVVKCSNIQFLMNAFHLSTLHLGKFRSQVGIEYSAHRYEYSAHRYEYNAQRICWKLDHLTTKSTPLTSTVTSHKRRRWRHVTRGLEERKENVIALILRWVYLLDSYPGWLELPPEGIPSRRPARWRWRSCGWGGPGTSGWTGRRRRGPQAGTWKRKLKIFMNTKTVQRLYSLRF